MQSTTNIIQAPPQPYTEPDDQLIVLETVEPPTMPATTRHQPSQQPIETDQHQIVAEPPKKQPLTFQDLGFQLYDDEDIEMDYDMTLEGIDVNNLDPYTDDEDFLDDVEDDKMAGGGV
jgi:hypothetical protein